MVRAAENALDILERNNDSVAQGSVRDCNATQQIIDIDCYEDEGAQEYGHQYDEVGQVVISLLLFSKGYNR
ncbi:hypothetical protein AUF78_07530 [archaeon 13_1_20CM_2_51_12]|nr:MAG: hypothetical protein AUF78_07530 [archaeon 13_1_20CM_2_51_12]